MFYGALIIILALLAIANVIYFGVSHDPRNLAACGIAFASLVFVAFLAE